jgi:hypothetical protein
MTTHLDSGGRFPADSKMTKSRDVDFSAGFPRCLKPSKGRTPFVARLAAESRNARLHTLCIPFTAKIRSIHP